ncbi:hippurate hydrolase [Pseudomonas syringae]|uniref:M20 aminoacylase family protein n=1 Tax=Pseudomonas syringae TaxID=317 RepID=UPI00089458EC|nr:M20 aminoacylase family protein [Pseudomonas syringae]SDX76318.1 hippurate hydrolase [Pseudomonas syringae]SFM83100.1 hippurate hydrolase [Pseudomonas syringae]
MSSYHDFPSTSLITDACGWRKDLHAHPELGYQEHRTSDKIAEHLEGFGLQVCRTIGGTGIVATLDRGQGPFIGLRADMDALPMQEKSEHSHRSINEGCMHACGHDGHTAILLATAKHLYDDRDFQGRVHFIFQPAEETGAGARQMIEDGLFARFPMDAVYGLHNWPGLPQGMVAVNPGAMMASQDTFEICIQGSGAHAAMPERGNDPVVIATQLVSALQTIVSRQISPLDSAVLSVTMIEAGTAYNVIPQTAIIRGTVRCLDHAVRLSIQDKITTMAQTLPTAFGASGTVKYREGYPVTQNDPQCAEHVREIAKTILGGESVRWDCRASMASEDFAYMLQVTPGAYFWLGADGDTDSKPLHHPNYDFNDALIPVGVRLFAGIAKSYQSK